MGKKIIFIVIFFFINNIIYASEKDYFLSLKNNKVHVRQGPSFDYPIKFIYKKKFLPLKIIDSHENFRKIIDFSNNSGWIHVSQLTKKRSAINIENKSLLFEKPKVYSKPLALIEEGKLLIIKKCLKIWCKVSANEFKGWVKKKNLWGRIN